jgi:hypothetical protein
MEQGAPSSEHHSAVAVRQTGLSMYRTLWHPYWYSYVANKIMQIVFGILVTPKTMNITPQTTGLFV